MEREGSVKNGRDHPSASVAAAEMSRGIREEARRLGFFKTGITSARPLPRSGEFDRWLEAGMHGDMGYMSRQAPKRKDPARLLADARSIVVVAVNYFAGASLNEEVMKGKISRYAWGDDYHSIVLRRLEALLAFVRREVSGADGLCYVDTGPVMEKVWGAESALGWMGKHSNLITREQGSWFFVGVILLNLELAYDEPEPDFCGSCVRCSVACPTGAIVAPYVVDARLCISYLTIEHRGSIPRELRPLIGNRIYGCDDCQEVCPWNRFAVDTSEPGFAPRKGAHMPELETLVQLSREEFNLRFENSPVRRAKRDGFVRNVVVALGNSRRSEAIPALSIALRDGSPLVRGHAAWALGQVGTEECRRLLEEAGGLETDSGVLGEIQLALGRDFPESGPA